LGGSTNLQTTTTSIKDWHEIMRIVIRVEQAIIMGKIEGSAMDSRTMMRDESEDNSEVGKPYLCGLAISHYSIMVGFWAIHLNSCKNFKNRDRMMVSKKRVEFVKDDVINHIITRTSSD
jgi:hypothetical protein